MTKTLAIIPQLGSCDKAIYGVVDNELYLMCTDSVGVTCIVFRSFDFKYLPINFRNCMLLHSLIIVFWGFFHVIVLPFAF